jgi:hypothetical protein
MLLRLKGETGEETAERLLPEPDLSGEESLADEALEADGFEDGDDFYQGRPSVPGPLVAAASFVPTFLAVFLGLSYLLSGGPASTAPAPPAPKPVATQSAPGPAAEPTRTAREGLSAPAPAPRPDSDRSPMPSTGPVAGIRVPESKAPEVVAPTVPAPEVKAPELALPPRPTPRGPEPAATESAPPPRVAKAPEPKAQPSPPPPPARTPAPEPPAPARPVAESASSTGPTSTATLKSQGWIPAAAFADRAAATRLASSIQQQDYPVEIREDRSSARPWVVWIGPEPRGSRRRR